MDQISQAADEQQALFNFMDPVAILELDELIHEVRTPLAAASLALESVEHDESAMVVLAESLHHLRELVTSTSRQVEGPCGVREQLFRAVRLVDTEQRVNVEHNLDDESFVGCAPVQFRQLLINLISNALKFSPSTSIVKVNATVQGGSLVLLVADVGEGMSTSEAQLIFEQGVRGETAAHIDGVGLGLSIARRLARIAGGDVTLGSTGPDGSVFVVNLPIITSPNQ
jgi:signal transduction histidine kinase